MENRGLSFKRLALGTIGLGFLFLFSGCNHHGVTPMRLGTNVWPGYEPLYLAREFGYINRDDIQLVELNSATQVMRALRNGALEAAALTLDEAVLLRQQGVALEVFLVVDESFGGDVIIARPEIENMAMLQGKRLGYESTALGAYFTKRALEVAGVVPTAVVRLPLTVDEQEQAFAEGAVDAVVTFEPVRSRLLAAGGREIFSSKQLEGEILDVLVVRRDYAARAENRRYLAQLIKGWFQALAKIESAPLVSSEIMSARLGLPPAEVLASLMLVRFPSRAENLALLSGAQPPLADLAERYARLMRARGTISQTVSPREMVVDQVEDLL